MSSSHSSHSKSDVESWDTGSSIDSSIAPDVTDISDSGHSTALSEDSGPDSTRSTINEVVVNVVDESFASDAEISSTKNVKSGTETMDATATNVPFTSSKIEFNKDDMLMVRHRSGSRRSSNLSSVSAIDSSGLNEKANMELSMLNSDAVNSTQISKTDSNSKTDGEQARHSKTKIIVGQNGSRSKNSKSKISPIQEETSIISSNLSTGHLTTNDELSETERSETLDEVSDVPSNPSPGIPSTNEEISDTEQNETFDEIDASEGMENEDDMDVNSLLGEEEEETMDNGSEKTVPGIDSGHLAVQELLRDYLTELEQQIGDLKNRKSRSMKPSSRSSQHKNQPQHDSFGKPMKEKFPYYPSGVIYPKCKSIMPNGPKGPPEKPFLNNFNNLGCAGNDQDRPIKTKGSASKTAPKSGSNSNKTSKTTIPSVSKKSSNAETN